MKILVTGYEGNIGRSLLGRGCYPLVADVTNHKELSDTVLTENPDLIIHCAAITNVDYCQAKENENEVIKTNYLATVDLMQITEPLGIPVIAMSSDHVFDGKRGSYSEYDPVKPVNYYGLSKATMEAACRAFENAYVVRTSFLFGKDIKDFGKYENLLISGTSFEVPTVLYRTFCHVEHFVEGLLTYASKIYRKERVLPLLHISGTENISWYELAMGIADCGGYSSKLIVPRSRKVDSFTPRPLNAGLNVNRAKNIGIPLFSFHDGLRLIYG